MIDSHCHLDHDPLLSNIKEVLSRSKNVGIKKLLTISTNLESYKNILKIIKIDPMIFGSIGIHPHEAKDCKINSDYIVNEFNNSEKIIGIGETGLDYYYENSPKKKQIESFKTHIDASIVCNSPLIVHSRDAEDDTYNILKDYGDKKIKILMHCFTGSRIFADKLLGLGSYFSASGIITFKNSLNLQDTFKNIPNEKILIETDSPFLAPVPMRGKKNEPSFIEYTLKHLAKIKQLDKSEMEKITTNNFNSLFFNNDY